jgi:hypothetical protein
MLDSLSSASRLWRIVMVLLLAVASLPGCLQSEDPGSTPLDPPQTTNGATTESGNEMPPVPGNGTPVSGKTLILSDCTDALVTFSYPPAEVTGTAPPPGWDSTFPHELRYEIQKCNRVAVDGFERGPRFMLMESHNNGVPPEACSGDYARARVLYRLWIDDHEIATHLQQVYGMPSSFAHFSLQTEAAAGEGISTWAFGAPDAETSMLRAHRDSPDETGEVVNDRYFWIVGDSRVSYIDLNGVFDHPALSAPLVTGDIKPPLLHGSTGPWVGYGGEGGGFQATAPIVEFNDLRCESPR